MNPLIVFFLVGIFVTVTMVLVTPNRIMKQVKATKAQRVLEAKQDAEFERKREDTTRRLEKKQTRRYELAQFDLQFFNSLPQTKPLILCEECKYLSTSSLPHSPTHCSGVVDPGEPADGSSYDYVPCQCPYCNGGTSYDLSYQR